MAQNPPSQTCPKRQPLADGKCRYRLVSGCCSLPYELTCVEWLLERQSGQKALPKTHRSSVERDVPPAQFVSSAQSPTSEVQQPASPRRGLTPEAIENFRALNVQVCLWSETNGEFWLVPAKTGQPRTEITPEHLATIAQALDVFPGSVITAFYQCPAGRIPAASAFL